MAKNDETDQPAMASAILALADAIKSGQSQTIETQAQLADTLKVLQQNQKPREINYGDIDYQAKLRAERKEFPRPVFQGGREADPSGLSDETLVRIAELKPGKYLGGFVTIDPAPNDGINFLYRNATPDQRMTQMSKFVSFTDLVEKCWRELQKPEAVSA